MFDDLLFVQRAFPLEYSSYCNYWRYKLTHNHGFAFLEYTLYFLLHLYLLLALTLELGLNPAADVGIDGRLAFGRCVGGGKVVRKVIHDILRELGNAT